MTSLLHQFSSGPRTAAAALVALAVLTASCGSGADPAPPGAPVSAGASGASGATGVAQPTGTLVFDHDVAGAPELALRASAAPPELLEAEDLAALPETVAPDAVASPLLQYGQQYRFQLEPGPYVVAMFDRDGNQVGLPFVGEAAEGTVGAAEPSNLATMTTSSLWGLTVLEPRQTPPAPGTAPPPGSPAATFLLDSGQIQVSNDLVDSAPVQFQVLPAGTGRAPQAGAPGSDGLLSPLLGPGQEWNAVVAPGDYIVTAWTAPDDVVGRSPVGGELAVAVSDARDPVTQQGAARLSDVRDAPPPAGPGRTPPG